MFSSVITFSMVLVLVNHNNPVLNQTILLFIHTSRVATGGPGGPGPTHFHLWPTQWEAGNFPNGCNLLNDTNKRLISL